MLNPRHMLKFILSKGAPEEIEVLFDDAGAEALKEYIDWVIKHRDHMHLLIDGELDPVSPTPPEGLNVFHAKHVRLGYEKASKGSG
jgi:hypothetical protein